MDWEKELEEYVESDEHSYQCASHSEGQTCCLEKRWIYDFIKGVRSEGYEATMKADTAVYNAVLDMAVKIHHEMLSEHGHKLCNCFREEFAKRLNDYLSVRHKEPEKAEKPDIDTKQPILDVMEDFMGFGGMPFIILWEHLTRYDPDGAGRYGGIGRVRDAVKELEEEGKIKRRPGT